VAQKFNASLAGGSLPDVVVVSDVTWFNFALNKQLSPLDDLLSTAKMDTSDYVDALYNDYNLDDKHYALPFSRSTPLFYYNKDLWKAAGLEDRGPKDWDEFLTWAPKLKAASGSDKIVMELPDGSNYLDWVFQNMVWGYGGAYSKEWTPTFSDPNTVKAGTYLQNLAKDGYLKLSKDPAPDFTAGIVGCSMMSTGSLGGVAKDAKFPVGTAFLPTDGNCPTGGAGVGIPANISDDRKKNALTFIEFLTNAQNTVTFTQATGYMPVRKSAVDLPEEKAFLEKNPNAKTAIEQLPKTRSQDNARVLLPGGGARIGKGLDQIVQGQDVATVFKALDAESQQVFDSQIKSKLGA
jgi:sn-glycerol 3-phosphate transport system substrate-binding protein